MAVHFTDEELSGRRERVCAAMAVRGLSALLLFRQESLYYLTGFDTFGYVFFQCLRLGADGSMTLLTRAPDLRQAQHTSVIDDIRVWVDGPDAAPEVELRAIMEDCGDRGGHIGIEWDAYGLTAARGRRLDAALAGFCETEDASDLVSRLRVVKSPAELEYVRRAAMLADDAFDAAVETAAAGVSDAAVLSAMQSAVLAAGGDYPANPFIVGSGRDALLCRYFSGRRPLDSADQITLEWAGVYRHYHACLMRTFAIGPAPERQREFHAVALEALLAVEAALRPGRSIGEAFDEHARVLDAAGLHQHRLNACGYSVGTTFAPNWMDWPMLYHGNPELVAEGMTIFIHIIIFDSDTGVAMTLGETVEITGSGAVSLSRAHRDLVVR